MKTKQILKTVGLISAISISLLMVISCDEGSPNIPSSGNNTIGAPKSIIGGILRMKFVEGSPLCFTGDVTLTFVDESTILGNGSTTNISKEWNYNLTNNTGRVFILNNNNTSADITLSFSTPTSGTYSNLGDLGPGFPSARCNGNFTLEQ